MLYDGVVWSSPYIDAFGFGVVISAAKRLYAEDGSTLGVAGLDITFANILKLMGARKRQVACSAPKISARPGRQRHPSPFFA